MAPTKYYFILSPNDMTEDLRVKAEAYYGSKDYKYIADHPECMNAIKTSLGEHGLHCNAKLLLIGSATIAMSMSDSIYVAKNWEDDDYCKVCHALAFSYGLEIVYES